MGKEAAEKKKKGFYRWTDADYKLASAPGSVEFRRCGAFRQFIRQRPGVDDISDRQFAIQISKTIRDDLPADRLMMKAGSSSISKKKQKTKKSTKSKKAKESFDLDSPAMKEEIERRVKWADYMKMRSKAIEKGKKKEDDVSDDDDDDDNDPILQELTRRGKWSINIRKRYGSATLDAAQDILFAAEQAVYS